MQKLTDNYGRKISNLRISITPRCNLNCMYCHREGEDNPGAEMSLEEISKIFNVASEFGISSVKITGGEPTVRKDICDIVSAVPDSMESSMTTNGTLLAPIAHDLKAAGLSRVNISLDSLNPEKYKKIAGKDMLSDVLEGIEAAVEAKLTPVKINVVMLKGVNDDELEDFVDFARGRREIILQFIELMDFKDPDSITNVDELEKDLQDRSKLIITRRMHHRKKYCLDGAEIEVVRPMHNKEFCANCNRLRVTSDGYLKPCLLRHDNHVNIRGLSEDEMRKAFLKAAELREPYFK